MTPAPVHERGLPAAASLPTHWAGTGTTSLSKAPDLAWLRAARAVASTMFCTHDGPPSKEHLDWTIDNLYDMYVTVGGIGLFVFRLSLFAFTWLAPLMILRLPPFSRLPHEDRLRAMHRFENSLIAIALFALKAMLCMIHFEHPDGVRHMNFDGQGVRHRHPDQLAPEEAV
jgi:hypothetical protein